MTKLTSEEIDRIVEHDIPEYRVDKSVDHNTGRDSDGDSARAASVEESTPEIDELRKKYLGDSGEVFPSDSTAHTDSATDTAPSGSAMREEPQDEIVAVTPKESSHAWDRGARPKAAVISGSEKKVIGHQG